MLGKKEAFLRFISTLNSVHDYELCLWSAGRSKETASVFDPIPWFNPSNNQIGRLLIAVVRAGESTQVEGGE